MYRCTCGPYWSIIPPPPCPIHDAANRLAYEKLKDYYREKGRGYTIKYIISGPPSEGK